MSEVPSSTILAIVGLIAALLVIAFIIAAYSSTRNGADAIVLSQEKQKRYIEESEYNVYQDEIFDGTQVMSTIKKYQGSDISIMVDNDGDAASCSGNELFFNYNVKLTDPTNYNSVWVSLGAKQTNDEFAANYRKAVSSDNASYVGPGDLYTGDVHVASNGTILGISFVRGVVADRTNRTDTDTDITGEDVGYTLVLDMGMQIPSGSNADTLLKNSGFTTSDQQLYTVLYNTKTGIQGVDASAGYVMSLTVQKPTISGNIFKGFRECNASWAPMGPYQDVITVNCANAMSEDTKYGAADHYRYFKAEWNSGDVTQTYKIEYYFEIDGSYPVTPDIAITNQATVGSEVSVSTDLAALGTAIVSHGSNRLNTAYSSEKYNYTGSNTFASHYVLDSRSKYASLTSGKVVESSSNPLTLKVYYRQQVQVTFDKGEGSREVAVKTITIPYGDTLETALTKAYGKVEFPVLTPLAGWTAQGWTKYKYSQTDQNFTTPTGTTYAIGITNSQLEEFAKGDRITEDIHYCVVWNTPEYIISIHLGKGSIVSGGGGWTLSGASTTDDQIYTYTYHTQSTNKNGAIQLPVVKPDKVGSTFWHWEENGYGIDISSVPTYVSGSNVGFIGNRIFTAVYTDEGEVTVTIDANGGYVKENNKGATITLAGKPNTALPSGAIKGFERAGYTQNASKKYYSSTGGAYAPEESRTYISDLTVFPDKNTTYYVNWIPDSHTIYVYNNDGARLSVNYTVGSTTGNNSSISYTVEEDVLITSPSRDNYTFDGWTVQYKNGQGQVQTEKQNTFLLSAGALKGDGEISVTANWIKNTKDTYTVEFYDARWKDPINTKHPEEGTLIGTLPTPPSKQGYVFVGWYKTPDNDKDDERNEDGSYDGRLTPNAVISVNQKYYAHWSEIEYICHVHTTGNEKTSVNVKYSKYEAWKEKLPKAAESMKTAGGCYQTRHAHEHTGNCYQPTSRTVTWEAAATPDGVTCPYCGETIYGSGEKVTHSHVKKEDSLVCGFEVGDTEYMPKCGYSQGEIIGTVPK
mgnify:CR=1 FL=1